MRAVAGGVGVVLLLSFSITGCSLGSNVPLAPEAAVAACEGPAALSLRAKADGFQSLTLAPAAATRIEPRATYVGWQPLAMVVAGHGTAVLGSGTIELD